MRDFWRENWNPDLDVNLILWKMRHFWWFLHTVLSMLTFRIFFIVLLFSFVFSSLCSSCSGTHYAKIPSFVQKVNICKIQLTLIYRKLITLILTHKFTKGFEFARINFWTKYGFLVQCAATWFFLQCLILYRIVFTMFENHKNVAL